MQEHPTVVSDAFNTEEDDVETWVLRIRPVRVEDEGVYECQVSTQPLSSFFIHLKVVGKGSLMLRDETM